jgi:hypothetical protein
VNTSPLLEIAGVLMRFDPIVSYRFLIAVWRAKEAESGV